METLGDLVARERRSDASALVARDGRSYDYHRFCTTAWKTGNFLRRHGVHAREENGGTGATVAVADDPAPEAFFSFLGAAMLGAPTTFRSPGTVDARAVVAPVETVGEYDLLPGGKRVGYGGPPEDPDVAHFERDVWSENPAFPETPLDPDTVALVADEREYTHAELLAAASDVADEWGLEAGDRVAVRAPLARPGTVVAGVVAPLLAGATVLVPDGEAVGDVAVAWGDERDEAPEESMVTPAMVAP